ncbi:type II toxin-antitoxin system PemK/MazF family toxin [Segnochrobactraceae bacterium EtOH-i3]
MTTCSEGRTGDGRDPGRHGKPHTALVIQADPFADSATVRVALLSSTLVDAPLTRLTVDPSPGNGLQRRSQVQVDKTMTVRREKVGSVIGRMEDRLSPN